MLVEIFSKVGNDSTMLLENIKLRYSKTTFSIYMYTHTLINFPLYKWCNLLIHFFHFLINCKSFNELTKDKVVFQRIWLISYFSHPVLLDDKAKKSIFSCYEAKNPHGLLIMGTYKYFLNQEIVEGKKLIEEAAASGDLIATYIHWVILPSTIMNICRNSIW